tara:strand:- start:3619 stop:3849 length:231 start_codon:yes stop_codon:yes gene_type:complete
MVKESYTEYGYRGLEELKAANEKIELLKKQIAEETKEKYSLYKRIKELNEELSFLKNKSIEMSTESGPEYIQKHRT